MNRQSHQVNGITLIELMVVVAILSIIAAVAVPAYQGYISTAKVGECRNEALAIQTAQEEFFLTNNSYFEANDVAALEGASNGLYTRSVPIAAADNNCLFNVDPGSTGNIATSYTIISTGTNDLMPEGELFRLGN